MTRRPRPVALQPELPTTFPMNSDPPLVGGAPFDGRQFHNLDGVPAGRGLGDVLRWRFLGGRVATWPTPAPPDAVAPQLPASVRPGEMAATFVGHSTFLLQFAGGLNLLTDPIWSQRASPVSFAGPRRARPPGLAWEALPPISAVLISHAHYDHLDLPTLRRLESRFQPVFITGVGNGGLLRGQGLGRIQELDWWQCTTVASLGGPANDSSTLEVNFTPAQHWSARSFVGRNRALWGGFWLRQGNFRAFFAGDSGLGRHFRLIRERLGAPDAAFLSIGAYEPRWFMREQHMNPADAVQAHLAVEAASSVAMHFGTFQLTDEGIDAPATALAASLSAHGLTETDFHVPRFGETMRFRHSDAPA
jgi:L-ascorbate metabolism protein UlaG (beta-lactamase superfamily)